VILFEHNEFKEGETQLLSTACTIYLLIFDKRYAQAIKTVSVQLSRLQVLK